MNVGDVDPSGDVVAVQIGRRVVHVPMLRYLGTQLRFGREVQQLGRPSEQRRAFAQVEKQQPLAVDRTADRTQAIVAQTAPDDPFLCKHRKLEAERLHRVHDRGAEWALVSRPSVHRAT